MSPRAACRLEEFGFEAVYDYTLGIADWKAGGLPLEEEVSSTRVVAEATRSDVPTALRVERLGDVHDRTTEAGWDEAIVLGCDRMVVGRLRGDVWERDRDLSVDDVMELGPTTVRPTTELEPLVGRMQKRETALVTVTTPQGVLVGVLRRDDAERVLAGEAPDQIWVDCDGCGGTWSAP